MDKCFQAAELGFLEESLALKRVDPLRPYRCHREVLEAHNNDDPQKLTRVLLTCARVLSAGAGSDTEHRPCAVGGRAGSGAAPQPRERRLPPSRGRLWREIQPSVPRRGGRSRRRAQAEAPGSAGACCMPSLSSFVVDLSRQPVGCCLMLCSSRGVY